MAHDPLPRVPSPADQTPAAQELAASTALPVAGSTAARLVRRLAGWRHSVRLVVVLELALLYSVTFVPLHSWLGMANSLLSIAPVAAAGGLIGLAAGLRAALGMSVLTVGLYGFVGHWDEALRTSAPTLFVLVLVGLAIGGCHDLLAHLSQSQQRVQAEVAQRRVAQAHLQTRERNHARVAELGRQALAGTDVGELAEEAIAAVQQTLGTEHCAVWQLTTDDTILRVGGSTPEGLVTRHVRYTLETNKPNIIDPPLSGVMVPIQGTERPFGVLGAHTVGVKAFTDEDVAFIQAVANVLGTAIQRAWTEQALSREAKHDPLTGLPNRALFRERLGKTISAATRSAQPAAVLYIDLDDFKSINDTLGHSAGDQVLVTVADALRAAVRAGDTAARLGGDEFAVLLRHPVQQGVAEAVAERILTQLSQPLVVAEHEVAVTPSIGIALTTADAGALDGDELLRQADVAMYQAKTAGKARFAIFEPSMQGDRAAPPVADTAAESASDSGLSSARKPTTRRSPRKSSRKAA